jgi:mRNA interferase RelE/StbE
VASYRLFIKPQAVSDIEAIGTKADRRRIVARIRALADEPRPPGCQKLSGAQKYRIRQGRYRIVYRIEDDRLIVTIVKVGHRRDVYRRGEA